MMNIKRCMIFSVAFAVMLLPCSVNRMLYGQDEEADVVKRYNSWDCRKYSPYLIDVNLYTAGGDSLHRKYANELQCMASALVEKQDIQVIRQSMGFYHDRLAGSGGPFYLGFDAAAEYDGSLDYGRFCTRLIRENVSGIAEETAGFYSVLDEQNVAGVVVTFRWNWSQQEGHVTVWIKKGDVRLFNSGKITAGELYQRSTITNTAGKVILLPI